MKKNEDLKRALDELFTKNYPQLIQFAHYFFPGRGMDVLHDVYLKLCSKLRNGTLPPMDEQSYLAYIRVSIRNLGLNHVRRDRYADFSKASTQKVENSFFELMDFLSCLRRQLQLSAPQEKIWNLKRQEFKRGEIADELNVHPDVVRKEWQTIQRKCRRVSNSWR